MLEVTITLESHDEELAVFGSRDQFLRQVRDAFGVKLVARHGEVRVEGDPLRVEKSSSGSRGAKGLASASSDRFGRQCGRDDRKPASARR